MKSLVGLRLTPTVERNRNANPVFRRVFTRGRALDRGGVETGEGAERVTARLAFLDVHS